MSVGAVQVLIVSDNPSLTGVLATLLGVVAITFS